MFSFRSMLVPAALAAAFAVPAIGCAQTQPNQPVQAQSQGQPHRGFGFMRGMRELNLTPQQHSQIRQLMQQYRQAHPRGSAPDPQARKQLRDKVMAVLTPAQQQQFKTEMSQRRSEYQRGRDRFPAPSPSPIP